MSRLSKRAHAFLRLQSGEAPTVAVAVSFAFVADAGVMIAQSTIDALFFARYGVSRLPVLYLIVGVAMFATTVGVGVLLARLGRQRTFLLIPSLICVAALGGRALLATGAQWAYGALWLLENVAEFTTLLAMWGLAGIVANTRQAKRFFPLIGAGGVLGLIVGGVVTGPLAGAFGPENLLFVWAFAMAGASALAWRLLRTHAASAHVSRAPVGRASGFRDGLRYVRRTELLRWMSASALLMSLLASLLYLPFVRAAAHRFPDPDKLAGFFGLFFAVAMGTALMLSLLVTSRLLTRFGVAAVVVVFPFLYAVAFGVIAVVATFITLTVFRFAQITWRSGAHSGTWEAIVNTIPQERRDRTRAFLTGVPMQLGTVLAGFVALAAERLDTPRILYLFGLGAAALAIVSNFRMRRAYPRALVAALREGRPTVFGEFGDLPAAHVEADATALAVLEELAADDDASIRQLAANSLGQFNVPAAKTALNRFVDRDDNPAVRITALRSLEGLDPRSAQMAARSHVLDSEPTVRLSALEVLARAGVTPDPTVLADPELSVRTLGAAMLVGRHRDAERVLENVACASEPESRASVFRAIATAPTTEAAKNLALRGLKDPSAQVRSEALRASATIAPEEVVENLVDALADPDAGVRVAAADALLPLLPNGAAHRIRCFAANSVKCALQDLRNRNRLGTPTDDRLVLLRDSLDARAERYAFDALRAAALLSDRKALTVALDSLAASDVSARANALEVVETVGEPAIVRPLLELWEPRRPGEADPRVIADLKNDPDDWIRACAEIAGAPLGGERMTRTLTTMPMVERVVFLRKVPLFTALPPQELQPIAAVAEEHVFSEGETIAAEGEFGDTLYVIVDGAVRVVAGDQNELATLGSGDVIGEMAVISSKPRMASLIAQSDIRVLEIRKPAFEAILRERPDTALAMMRVLCERLAALGGLVP